MPIRKKLILSLQKQIVKIQISGRELTKSDCIGCHNKDKKVVGPSYVDIANKYAPE
jgi:cytochrome c